MYNNGKVEEIEKIACLSCSWSLICDAPFCFRQDREAVWLRFGQWVRLARFALKENKFYYNSEFYNY